MFSFSKFPFKGLFKLTLPDCEEQDEKTENEDDEETTLLT